MKGVHRAGGKGGACWLAATHTCTVHPTFPPAGVNNPFPSPAPPKNIKGSSHAAGHPAGIGLPNGPLHPCRSHTHTHSKRHYINVTLSLSLGVCGLQLWYPVADHPAGSTLPNGPLHPRWIPEYSATVADPVTGVLTNMVMMTVNGRTYPRHVSDVRVSWPFCGGRRGGDCSSAVVCVEEVGGRWENVRGCNREGRAMFCGWGCKSHQHMCCAVLKPLRPSPPPPLLLLQTVYPDAYRLRILNGCNSRTMQLRFAR